MHTPLRFCIALALLLAIVPATHAKAILQGTVSFLNSGSRSAAGVKISAFGANDCYTTDAGMFRLEFPDKKPGDKVKIIVGSNDRDGLSLELVNDKVIAHVRIPSNPDDDIVEIIVCKVGQRNDAALRYNGLIVKTINETMEKRLKEIDEKLGAAKIDVETIVALQNEKEKLAAERDSALVKAEEQALYIASINLDKASQLVKNAVLKVDSLRDIPGAILVLDNEILYHAYLEASEKKKKAESEIHQVVAGFEFKIKLLEPMYRYGEIAECYEKIAGIYEREGFEKEKLATNLFEAAKSWGENGDYQKLFELSLQALTIREKILPVGHPDLAMSYVSLAISHGKINQHQKALEFNQKALAIWEKVLPADHPDLAMLYLSMAVTYGNLNERQKQLEFNLKSLSIREKVLPTNYPNLATSYNNLAFTYGKLGDYQKQLEFNQKALAIREKNLPANHPDLSWTYFNLAWTYYNIGDYQKHSDLRDKALVVLEKVIPIMHPNWTKIYDNLGFASSNFGDYQKQLEFRLKALSIREKILPSDHPDLAWSFNDTGCAYAKLHQFPQAKDYFEKYQAINSSGRVFRNWAMYYALQNDKTKAIENLQKAISLGYKDLKWIETDDSLESIRGEQAYKEIVEQLKKGQ